VCWAAVSELVPLYPLYALLFLDTGLSEGQVSALFAVWSMTALVAEVPAGALADRWSRRGALALGGALQAAAFAVWTLAPGVAGFTAGFVVWGVGGALTSGTAEAVVHDGLEAVGAEAEFGRVNGRMTACELLVQFPTAALAGLLFAVGGYAWVGWASVLACLAAALLALRFPEPPREREEGLLAALREGAGQAVRRGPVRLAVLAVALVGGLDAMEEYWPVVAGERGVDPAVVPAAVLVVALAGAGGALLGGRADELPDGALPALLAGAGALLLGAAVVPGPAALLLIAAGYALYLAVLVAAEARLQERIEGAWRATVTSVAGLGIELAALPVFAAWALGGLPAVAVLVLAVVPVVGTALRYPAR
jgi:MFS family permease